ncbi:MAG: substrate-binding domain-containing protein [Planctomycetaceae bacterium]|jgi:phosphate transport system substrate-binding protein|nr:substrate-binding domain-containing protein [Planctomycetaceae bacterium]
MTDIPIIETESTKSKPFSTTGYLVKTTFWATLLPGMIVSAPVLFLACFSPVFFITIPIFVCCAFLFYCFNQFRKQFATHLQNGNVPNNFLLCVLPFFLPLFYILILTATAFYFVHSSQDILYLFAFFGLPHYAGSHLAGILLVILFNVPHEVIFFFPIILSFIVMIWGVFYVSRFSVSVTQRKSGLVVFFVLTIFLCLLVYQSQQHFRETILAPRYGNEVIGEQDTLFHYKPFSENNQLVKIDSPTLQIDQDHPKIHGALALFPVYAAAVEAVYRNIDAKKSNTIIQGGPTPIAFESLLSGNSDMVFMAMPSEKQWAEAESRGIKLSVTPIGYEAFVFFVSRTNPVDHLTLEQIRNIYSKRITHWSDVGGNNQKILPFQRPEGSGSQTMMIQVMGDVPLAKPVREEFQGLMEGIVQRVADYRNYSNSIGFSFRYFVEGMFKHDGVKLLRINGIEPTVENIQNGSYPLIGQIVIITIGNKKPNVSKLTDWFLSVQGQDLVGRVGYVPLREKPVTVTPTISEHQ